MTISHEHPHQHGQHEHGHQHDVVAEGEQHHGPSHDGSVVLDIGGDVGAVVLHVPSSLAGAEIDIVGLEPGTVSTHSLVRERILPAGSRYAAVYPGLPRGAYRIAATAGFPAADLRVHGGAVAEVDWTG